jgi:CHAT domain-containing protein
LGDDGVVLLTSGEATEPRIKRDAPGRRVVHLATHGFFATGKVRSALEGDDGAHRSGFGAIEMMGQRGVIGFNPMVLSGVTLSGANVRAAGEVTRGDDDGVLTAEEVASLDLRGAELVVLSACDTGLGEVKSGEGVLGLRRAFAFAGARALVMSLWKVPDQETMELMKTFYAMVKAEPTLDKGEAMRTAQLELIDRLRQRDGLADPRLWAAWVVSGR